MLSAFARAHHFLQATSHYSCSYSYSYYFLHPLDEFLIGNHSYLKFPQSGTPEKLPQWPCASLPPTPHAQIKSASSSLPSLSSNLLSSISLPPTYSKLFLFLFPFLFTPFNYYVFNLIIHHTHSIPIYFRCPVTLYTFLFRQFSPPRSFKRSNGQSLFFSAVHSHFYL